MKTLSFKTMALAAALLVAAVLPMAAFASAEQATMGRQIAVTDDIAAFFKAHGVDPQYLGKARSAVPASQWNLILDIVNTQDVVDTYADDHDVLNGLVGTALYSATDTIGDPVYMTLGNNTWIHEIATE
jgi:hypothetical protein